MNALPKSFIIVLLLSSFSVTSWAIADTKFQIKFIENKGQWTPEVLFKADIPGGHLFVSKNCLTYYLIDKKAVHDHQHGHKITQANAQVVKVFFEKATLNDIEVSKHLPFEEYYNFFIGSQNNWQSKVRAYGQIVLKIYIKELT